MQRHSHQAELTRRKKKVALFAWSDACESARSSRRCKASCAFITGVALSLLINYNIVSGFYFG